MKKISLDFSHTMESGLWVVACGEERGLQRSWLRKRGDGEELVEKRWWRRGGDGKEVVEKRWWKRGGGEEVVELTVNSLLRNFVFVFYIFSKGESWQPVYAEFLFCVGHRFSRSQFRFDFHNF